MKKLVLVVNGRPRAGKDTSVAYLETQFQVLGWKTMRFSSIDPIKDAVYKLGINTAAKTGKDRDLLAEVGRSLETYNGYRTKACLSEMERFFQPAVMKESRVFFLHMREPDLIGVMEGLCSMRGIRFHTIEIKNPRVVMVTSNAADAGVEDMTYNHTIINAGTYANLAEQCTNLVQHFWGPVE